MGGRPASPPVRSVKEVVMRRARRSTGRATLVAVVAGTALTAGAAPGAADAASANAQDTYAAARQQAQGLVGRMTLDEKVQLVHGVGFQRNAGFAGRIAGIPRLGIPDIAL